MTKIIVPATSANMGPGFDSLGLAVNLYLTVTIVGPSSQWLVHHPFGPDVPSDEKNMIVLSALTVDHDIEPQELRIESDIPLARGLGSSSSAIIAGLLLGNELSSTVTLSSETIFQRAAQIEGHPDNVAPAVFGGIVVAGPNPAKPKTFLHYQVQLLADYLPIVVIPDRQLATSTSRDVLPDQTDRRQSVQSSAQSNILVASLFNNDWANTVHLLETDRFHEPYRLKLVPELTEVRRIAHDLGLSGSYLSGAGTTVMTIVKKDQAGCLLDQLKKSEKLKGAQIQALSFDAKGARVIRD
ncbi:MAG: homoserine kinase [Oenococcus sp.]|uniref:homoserine kinase n=1 Tax=Oenococcus sp. TaxID=1979414 RepID=UPI0039EC1547